MGRIRCGSAGPSRCPARSGLAAPSGAPSRAAASTGVRRGRCTTGDFPGGSARTTTRGRTSPWECAQREAQAQGCRADGWPGLATPLPVALVRYPGVLNAYPDLDAERRHRLGQDGHGVPHGHLRPAPAQRLSQGRLYREDAALLGGRQALRAADLGVELSDVPEEYAVQARLRRPAPASSVVAGIGVPEQSGWRSAR